MTAMVLGLAAPIGARERREQTDRVHGQTRITTATAVARATFDSADTAVITGAHAWPDALTGSALAGTVAAPILLTHGDAVPDAMLSTLDDLGVRRTYIIGGVDAVSDGVEAELDARGYDTPRVAGVTQFHTAAEVARQTAANAGAIGTIDGEPTVFVANGLGFADALTGGPGAFANANPLILTRRDVLPEVSREAIQDVGATRAVILGGELAVSDQVRQHLETMGLSTRRVGGVDRSDTAQKVASFLIAELGFDPHTTVLTTGATFPDALAAAPHAGTLRAPLILARDAAHMDYNALQWLANHADEQAGEADIEMIRALGGPQSLSSELLERVAEVAAPPNAIYTYSVESRGAGIGADELAYFSEHIDWTLVDDRGWSLGNDVRWDRVDDPGVADINVYLATPAAVDAADPGCSPSWSCPPAGTNDVYINVDEWRDPPSAWDGHRINDYRHYVVLHEFGHAPPINFGHLRCDEYYADADGAPAPVMEQQSQGDGIGAGQCSLNVWPLPGELDHARDALLGGASAESTASTDTTEVLHEQP